MAARVRQRRRGLVVLVVAGVAAGAVGAAGASAVVGQEGLASAAPATAAYVPIEPLRLADTREPVCGCSRLSADTISIDVAGHPSIPDDVSAVAISVTATTTAAPGYVTAHPGGVPRPRAAMLNTRTDRNVSNSAIVPVGLDGTIELFQRARGDLVVDVTGAFVPAATSTEGRFVPIAARRLVDTRLPGPLEGKLVDGGEITVGLPSGVAADAIAIVVNVASVGVERSGHLAARAAGRPRTTTAFMTVPGGGEVVSNATIVPVTAGGITIRSQRSGHVVVDAVGWFTGPTAPETDEGLFVPIGPTRLLDTREAPPRIWPSGTIEIGVPFPDAGAIVTNVAVTRADGRGYVTAKPARTSRTVAATVNASFHDHTIANLALTQVSNHGVAYSARAGVDLVVDVTGYFTGLPIASTGNVPPNPVPRSRVLIVGDSTLRGLGSYPGTGSALVGFDAIVDAASCRRLQRPSCRSWDDGSFPPTTVETILGTPGQIDIVVVKAGYNDWFSDFPAEFDAVVQAARGKGAHTIVWLSYNESVVRSNARRAYQENNLDLRRLVALPRYRDVLLADWSRYSDLRPGWFFDGTHVTPTGAYALGDFVSRWIAAVEHRPCPRPWTVGAPRPDPCPIPEQIGSVPDPVALY